MTYTTNFDCISCVIFWIYIIHILTVHGFAQASYDVVEGERLDTTFELNVKGTTTFPDIFTILGGIISESGTASE